MTTLFQIPIIKADSAQRIVYGWASVIEENGAPVIDKQGDTITPDMLARAAHEFMAASRQSKAMHEGSAIGTVVESMVLTMDVQKSLGIDLGRVGWYIGMQIHDGAVWAKITDGTYREFSIGGRAKRTVSASN